MKIYDKKDFRYIISFFIFFFIIWFYIIAYLSTLSIFLLIPSLVLIITFLFKNKNFCLYTPIVVMIIYFLLFNILPSKQCGFNDWKPPAEISGSKPCNCFGIIKYTDSWMKMECIGKIIEER